MTALKPEPRKLSDAEYGRLTMSEKIEYANGFTPEARQVNPSWGQTWQERWTQQQAETNAYVDAAFAAGHDPGRHQP
jgi:hypothetical protein